MSQYVLDILAPFVDLAQASNGALTISTTGKAVIDIEPTWIARTIAVGVVKQARANLRAGKGPDGTVLPPLKVEKLQVVRGKKTFLHVPGLFDAPEKLVHQQRGIVTGELMRSIKSRSVGTGAEVYVEGRRGQQDPDGSPSAAASVFLGTFVGNLNQPHIQAALAKVAQRIVDQQVQVEMTDALAGL